MEGYTKVDSKSPDRGALCNIWTREKDGHWTHFLNERSPGGNPDYRHDMALTGLATLCLGGGNAVALSVEAV